MTQLKTQIEVPPSNFSHIIRVGWKNCDFKNILLTQTEYALIYLAAIIWEITFPCVLKNQFAQLIW